MISGKGIQKSWQPVKGGRIVCSVLLAIMALMSSGRILASDEDCARRFSHKDWDLACDNTRTCRAAGYQAEELNEPPCPSGSYCMPISPVSLRITRVAGSNAPVAMTLRIDSNAVSDKANSLPTSYRLQVGAVDLRGLKMDSSWEIELTPAQAHAVMSEMLKPKVSEAWVWFGDDASGDPDGRLSLAGLNAMLLKMDEWQGRVGTPGALIRRGRKPEASVLPPVPMPVVKVAAPVPTRPADADLAERIFPLLDLSETDCANADETRYGRNSIIEPAIKGCTVGARHAVPLQEIISIRNCRVNSAKSIIVSRLTNQRVLLSLSDCVAERLPLDISAPHWIANDSPPYSPQIIEAAGEFNKNTMSISGSGFPSGRGYDCSERKTWHFNGQKFVLTYAHGNNCPCRDLSGWMLETYVSRVIPANSSP